MFVFLQRFVLLLIWITWLAKKNREKYQLKMEVYKQTKEEEAMSLKKEEEEMMKLQKQEAMQMLKKKEKTENIIKVHFFSFIIVDFETCLVN